MDKNIVLVTIVALAIILFALLIVNQYVLSLGDLFGYIYYVVIAVGIIAAIGLLATRGKSPVTPLS